MKGLLICMLILCYLTSTTLSDPVETELDGFIPYSHLGYAVSKAGDFNSDGFGDILISSYTNSPTNQYASNLIYVLFGSKDGFSNIDLENLTFTQGIKLITASFYNIEPASISGAGDVNGDGIDDIIIGTSSWSSEGNTQNGIAQVIFGKKNELSDMNLTNLTSAQGFSIYGENNGDSLGVSVKGVGDINGDGIDDIIVGAPGAGLRPYGAAYVIFGNSQDLTNIFISNLTNKQGITITDSASNGYFGSSVGSAGDVNGDGIDDVIIGASLSTNNGSAFVIFGSKNGLSDIDTSSLSPSQGFEIIGANDGDSLGSSVSGAGDVNGDGIDDVLIGAKSANVWGRQYAGAAYVIYGNRGGYSQSINLNDFSATQGFRILGSGMMNQLGGSVSDVGDFNGDGVDDVIVGAHYAVSKAGVSGAAYVIFGSKSGLSDVDTYSLTAAQGVKLSGEYAGDCFGDWVSNAGDIDGDGVDELLIGADVATRKDKLMSGAVYVVSPSSSNVGMFDEILV